MSSDELRARAGIPVGLIVGAIVFLGLTGFGRGATGPGASERSRYLYVVAALVLPALRSRRCRDPTLAGLCARGGCADRHQCPGQYRRRRRLRPCAAGPSLQNNAARTPAFAHGVGGASIPHPADGTPVLLRDNRLAPRWRGVRTNTRASCDPGRRDGDRQPAAVAQPICEADPRVRRRYVRGAAWQSAPVRHRASLECRPPDESQSRRHQAAARIRSN